MSIQFRRGDESKRLASTEVLLAGQPFFEKDTKKLYIGDGTTQLKSLSKIEANDSDAAHLSANNTFTGDNVFSKQLTVGANADGPGWGTSTVIDGNKIFFRPIGASKIGRYMSSEDKLVDGTQFIKLFVTAKKNNDTDKIYFPDTAGTLALTTDIPIKTATLSGTTLSITLS